MSSPRRICRSDKMDIAYQDTGMSIIDRKRDRKASIVLLALLAYVMLLQGLATAYARTLMATDQLAPAIVICAPSGKTERPPADPLEHVARKCCNALCEAAAAIGPSIKPPGGELPWGVTFASLANFDMFPAQALQPDKHHALPAARAPPHSSI